MTPQLLRFVHVRSQHTTPLFLSIEALGAEPCTDCGRSPPRDTSGRVHSVRDVDLKRAADGVRIIVRTRLAAACLMCGGFDDSRDRNSAWGPAALWPLRLRGGASIGLSGTHTASLAARLASPSSRSSPPLSAIAIWL
eukprot:7149908-Prymnesium_polylepis.3